jgi:hypothetical protein
VTGVRASARGARLLGRGRGRRGHAVIIKDVSGRRAVRWSASAVGTADHDLILNIRGVPKTPRSEVTVAPDEPPVKVPRRTRRKFAAAASDRLSCGRLMKNKTGRRNRPRPLGCGSKRLENGFRPNGADGGGSRAWGCLLSVAYPLTSVGITPNISPKERLIGGAGRFNAQDSLTCSTPASRRRTAVVKAALMAFV